MAEYITREALLALAEHQYVTYSEVLNTPAADVAPVVHGKWGKPIKVDADNVGYKCSNCGEFGAPCWNYCPNCGARMDGELC